ncbi:MAG: hypothetical protein ABF289_13120 [Clostridiales bacterium]
MPIYSVPLSDELILKKVFNSKKILIIGCGACANISCNIHNNKNEPAFKFFMKPISIHKEISRLSLLLSNKNYEVDYLTLMGLCTDSNSKQKKILTKVKNADTIIVMSCTAGKNTILSTIKNKHVIHGMKVKGFISIRLKRTGINTYVKLLNDNVTKQI